MNVYSSHRMQHCPGTPTKLRMARSSKRAASSAFTLIEILVVVAIIGVLAGLAIAGYGGAIDSSNKAASVSNLRQIAVLLSSFAAENNGNLPGFVPSPVNPYGRTSFGFTHDVAKQLVDGGYVKDTKVFFAPNDRIRRPTASKSTNGWATNPEAGDTRPIWSGYWHVYVRPGATPASSIEQVLKPRARMTDPADCIIALDQYQVGSYAAWNRDGGVNALRLGGHVTYLPKSELNPALGAAQFARFETPR